MEQVVSVVDPLRQFAKDSYRLVKRCNKPDLKGKVMFKCSHHYFSTVILVL